MIYFTNKLSFTNKSKDIWNVWTELQNFHNKGKSQLLPIKRFNFLLVLARDWEQKAERVAGLLQVS